MIKNKLKIGEFSRLGRVTVRALRHYEEIGLLVPDGIWNQEDEQKWLTIIQVPIQKA